MLDYETFSEIECLEAEKEELKDENQFLRGVLAFMSGYLKNDPLFWTAFFEAVLCVGEQLQERQEFSLYQHQKEVDAYVVHL